MVSFGRGSVDYIYTFNRQCLKACQIWKPFASDLLAYDEVVPQMVSFLSKYVICQQFCHTFDPCPEVCWRQARLRTLQYLLDLKQLNMKVIMKIGLLTWFALLHDKAVIVRSNLVSFLDLLVYLWGAAAIRTINSHDTLPVLRLDDMLSS